MGRATYGRVYTVVKYSIFVYILRLRDHGLMLPVTKSERFKNSLSSDVCIALHSLRKKYSAIVSSNCILHIVNVLFVTVCYYHAE